MKYLITYLALGAMLITLANALSAGYQMSHKALLQGGEDVNRVYAQKMAQMASLYLQGEGAIDKAKEAEFSRLWKTLASDKGAQVLLVDQEGRIRYSAAGGEGDRLPSDHPVLARLAEGKGGTTSYTAGDGQEILAGFAPVGDGPLGVIVLRSKEAVTAPILDYWLEIAQMTLPLFLVTLFLTIWIARSIAKPLYQLSGLVERASQRQEPQWAQISPWYYEAKELKKAVVKAFDSMHHRLNHLFREATTDSLTGLYNRRTLETIFCEMEKERIPFSLIVLDVDRFKRVNDTFGHQIGDEVLKFLAEKIKQNARSGDICCRLGGEEFVILLPGVSKERAHLAAERLRKSVSSEASPTGEAITISLGIAAYPQGGEKPEEVLEKADQCLYEAKNKGRNCVVVHQESTGKAYNTKTRPF